MAGQKGLSCSLLQEEHGLNGKTIEMDLAEIEKVIKSIEDFWLAIVKLPPRES